MEKLKVRKLHIPGQVCPVCERSFNKNSRVAVVEKGVITHADICAMQYLIDKKNEQRLEGERDRLSRWDFNLYFIHEYETSSKVVSENEFNEYKKKFARVAILNSHASIMKSKRDLIWHAVGRQYLRNLQYLHALSHVYEQNKNKWRNGFKTTFIPSVISQFKTKGYLSKKQMTLVVNLVNELVKDKDRAILIRKLYEVTPDDLMTVELPDRLRFMQRRKSFMEWFNKKNGIPEEE